MNTTIGTSGDDILNGTQENENDELIGDIDSTANTGEAEFPIEVMSNFNYIKVGQGSFGDDKLDGKGGGG